MSLSICLLTREPASRVAALLQPLRPLADEIVIAADDSVGEETLGGYAALGDRVFAVDFRLYERHLSWLHAQCQGDWILRLDGDEFPSAAFVRRLPELLARRDVQHYWVKRAWLFPDAGTMLDELPWSTDYLNCLTRNDGTLRFQGRQHTHATPVVPAAYVEEPVYHLELVLASERARRAKAIRYEVIAPHLVAHGGGRLNEAFYLPELRPRLRTRDTASDDQSGLAKCIAASSRVPAAPTVDVRRVTLAETDALWADRAVDPAGCRAALRCLEEHVRFTPDGQRPLFVEVANTGTEHWPGGLADQPLIRLAYRWLHVDGSVQTAEGRRTPFPSAVAPGARVIVPLDVVAPPEAGSYLLEVDVVHESVRWFQAELRIPVTVAAPDHLPPCGTRLRETPRPRLQRLRRVRIPRVVHRVWVGDSPMPAELQALGATFAEHHPGWALRLWQDADLAGLGITDEDRALARTPSELSNLVRYEILRHEGGLYVDTDVECRRDLTPLLRGVHACAALELPGRVGTAVLAAEPGHPLFVRAADETRSTLGRGAHSPDANGPYFLSLLIEQEADVTIFSGALFYPYLWNEPERARDRFPEAFAVHHWSRVRAAQSIA